MFNRVITVQFILMVYLFFFYGAIIYIQLEKNSRVSAEDRSGVSPFSPSERYKETARLPSNDRQRRRASSPRGILASTPSSRRYDLQWEPLTSSYYTKCTLGNASEGSRYGCFERKKVAFKGLLNITDNRTMPRISSLQRVDRLNVARRDIAIQDQDFFRKVAHSTVTSNLFDADDEEYLKSFSHYFILRPYLVNQYVPRFLIGQDIGCSTTRNATGRKPGTKAFLESVQSDVPYVLVIVFTEHTDVMLREAIRKTWGQVETNWANDPEQESYRIKLVFMLGYREEFRDTQLEKEAALKRDIVQADFIDTYRNLSLKMVTALYWARDYCPGVQHVLKVDSDTFVNMMLLTELLSALPSMAQTTPGHRWMLGHVNPKPVVIKTDVDYGRWKVDNDLYPFDQFPTYLYGHSYVISGCVIEDLLRGYHRMPLIPVEDAYFTGVLAKALGIRRLHSPWFATYFKYPSGFSLTNPDLVMDVTTTHFEDWTTQLQFYLTFIAKYIHNIRY